MNLMPGKYVSKFYLEENNDNTVHGLQEALTADIVL
jgi:hypothetical protein